MFILKKGLVTQCTLPLQGQKCEQLFFIFKTFDNNGTGSFTGYIFKLVRLGTLPKLGTIRCTFKT